MGSQFLEVGAWVGWRVGEGGAKAVKGGRVGDGEGANGGERHVLMMIPFVFHATPQNCYSYVCVCLPILVFGGPKSYAYKPSSHPLTTPRPYIMGAGVGIWAILSHTDSRAAEFEQRGRFHTQNRVGQCSTGLPGVGARVTGPDTEAWPWPWGKRTRYFAEGVL